MERVCGAGAGAGSSGRANRQERSPWQDNIATGQECDSSDGETLMVAAGCLFRARILWRFRLASSRFPVQTLQQRNVLRRSRQQETFRVRIPRRRQISSPRAKAFRKGAGCRSRRREIANEARGPRTTTTRERAPSAHPGFSSTIGAVTLTIRPRAISQKLRQAHGQRFADLLRIPPSRFAAVHPQRQRLRRSCRQSRPAIRRKVPADRARKIRGRAIPR